MVKETARDAVTVGTQIDERIWTVEELGEEHRARERVSVGIQTKESFLRLQDQDGHLLPGLPNEITLDQIVPKLPWTAFHVLSLVRRRWQHAIRSHQVHDARVRSHSTDTLIVIHFYNDPALTLYSMTDRYSCDLPFIPPLDKEDLIPNSCVSLNGRIYAFGGEDSAHDTRIVGGRVVSVLDLAGQREWRQCASMKHRRHDFGCGAKDGKIYVFGGCHRNKPVRGCEVYDPEQNSWSRIAPMEFWRHRHQVASLGEELYVYGGYVFDSDQGKFGSRVTLLWEAYHPLKNEWRRLGERPRGEVFMAQGRFHLMSEVAIDVYDHEKNTWSHLHSTKFVPDESRESLEAYTCSIIAVDDELLVVACLPDDEEDRCFFRGKGLGGKNAEILFEEESSLRSEEADILCTIQL